MPYLQLDLNGTYPAALKQQLAATLSTTCAHRKSVDIRRGRLAELRMEVIKALCAHCIELLGLREHRLHVEFTQHSVDEMYHPALGGYIDAG